MALCSFFGHRDTGEQIRPALAAEIERNITDKHIDTFYVGGYGNFDRMASGILSALKGRYPHISVFRILAYLPTKAEDHPPADQPPTLFPDGLELVPRRYAITHRNRWIVDASDTIIAYVTASYGGAYDALKYARQKHKTIVNLSELQKCDGE